MVKFSEIVTYLVLGPEAIYRLMVRNFPAIVATDCRGNDLYIRGSSLFSNKISSIVVKNKNGVRYLETPFL